ncbi:MAG: FAD-dependent oxidoreductase [Bifidobacteriaceae bacterium]|jgi:prenylcysteine oxidase/farnesylcysteine lyase|nr:FAD-dependent oxidoreductase [Bifidobacteriaceae bacterium]
MAKKVAVIGAGSSGAEIAYSLYKKFGKDVFIDVYERNAYAGGRTHAIEFAGQSVEVGGTVVHSSNLYVLELMDFAGVKEDLGAEILGQDSGEFWFWDGKQVYLRAKNSTISFAVNLIRKFGPFSSWFFRSHALKSVGDWKWVYKLLDEETFTDSHELVKALRLQEVTSESLAKVHRKKRINPKLTAGFCGAITQNMYLQDENLNAFAGEVGLAGAGLVGGHLFAVEGGNGNLFTKVLDKLAEHGVAKVNYSTAVTKVTPNSVTLSVPNADGNTKVAGYDAVLVAVPFELSGITAETATGEPIDIPLRDYKEVHVTLVVGDLKLAYFGQSADTQKVPPDCIFVKANQGLPYKSIGLVAKTSDGKNVYKLFSDEPLAEQVIDDIFTNVTDKIEWHWQGAYPVLTPTDNWQKVQLTDGLYYVNGFESAAASIETNMVAARNATNLAGEVLG